METKHGQIRWVEIFAENILIRVKGYTLNQIICYRYVGAKLNLELHHG